MKKIFYKLLCILSVFILSAGFPSCLKEKRDDCIDPRGNVRVVVRLDDEQTRLSSYTHDIRSVHLYVFDSDNTLIMAAEEQRTYLPGEDYEIWLNLDKGKYDFVVWTNLGEDYEVDCAVTDDPSLDDLKLAFNHGDDVTEHMPDLHYGNYRDAVVLDNRNNEFPIRIIPNTNLINIAVLGMPDSADTYSFAIADNNCHYTFNNTFAEHPGREGMTFRYIQGGIHLDETLFASIKTLKLAADRAPVFTFTNTTDNRILFKDNLVSMIQRAYAAAGQGNADFDLIHVYDLTLKFDINMGVTVTINNWEYSHQPDELGR